MAENIKTQVLTVETGGAITNVKEYKKYLDELKGTLLGLEKGTEEYNKVANELREGQQKLNEVMDVAKGRGDAVEGSYDHLSKTMSELKRQFKATGDAAERANLAVKINAINDQLKEMDASVGVYSRNVGNYANAFEDAFKNILGDIGQADGALGDLAVNIKSLVPLIKKTTTVATTGLKGIKKALMSIGIGLIIVAISELIANWDKLVAVVRKAIPAFREADEITKQQVEDNEKLLEVNREASSEMDYQARIMEAQGKSTLVILAYKKAETEALLANTQAQIAETNAKIESLKAHSAWTRFWKGENKQIKDLEESLKGLTAEQEKLTASLEKLGQDIVIENIKVKNQGAKVEVEIQPVLTRLDDFGKSDLELLKSHFDKRREEILANYEKEKELLKQHGLDTTTLTAEYYHNLVALDKEYNEEYRKVIEERAKAENLSVEEILAIEELKKGFDIRRDEIKARYDEEIELLRHRGSSTLALTADYYQQLLTLDREYDEEYMRLLGDRVQADQILADEEIRIQEEITSELDKLLAEQIKSIESEIEEEQRLLELRKQNILSFTGSVQSIMRSVASAWYDSVEAQVEAGKMSEEEGERQFEQIKALQTAEAIINTIAGAVGAFMGITKDTGGWGIVAAAAQAAAVLAAGFAEVNKIQNTTLGSKSTASSSFSPDLANIANEINPSYTQNITNATETEQLANALRQTPLRAYVVESDITEAQKLANQRVEETSW